MKKSTVFLSLLCICLSILISCKKSGFLNDPEKIDIGLWHNNALVLYTKSVKNLSLNSNTHNDIREQVLQLLVKNDPSKFDEKAIKDSFKTIDDLEIGVNINAGLNTGEVFDKLSLIIGYLKTTQKISENLAFELEKIHSLTKEGADGYVILQLVNDLKIKSLVKKDQNFINAFVGVYNASYSFWNENSKVEKTTSYNKNNKGSLIFYPTVLSGEGCNQSIILADAAGALYGMLLGPVGSVIEAATFSLIASINPPCRELQQ